MRMFIPKWLMLAPDNGTGGNLVATTQNFVNAYTGAQTAFDDKNTMAPEIKTWYQTEALENARAKHYFAQFMQNVPLPKNHGMTVEKRKPNTFPSVKRLTEGVIPAGEKFGYSAITMQVYEYGMYAALGRRLETHATDPVAQDMTEEMGAAGGDTQDKLARNTLLGGANVLFCPNESGAAVNARSGLTEKCVLTPDMVARARTWLKKRKAPLINGRYYALIHPSVAYDLRKSDAWIEAHKYAAPEEIFNGEIGELHGVRFIEADNAKVHWGADLAKNSRNLAVNGAISSANKTVTFKGGTVDTNALVGRYVLIGNVKAKVEANTTTTLTLDAAVTAEDNAVIYPGEGGAGGIATYSCIFLGKDAAAMIDVDGGSMEMIIKSREQAGGPLNQFGTIGIYFETGSGIQYEDRILRVECGSAFSSADQDTDEEYIA